MNSRLFTVLVVLTTVTGALLSCGRVSNLEPFATAVASARNDQTEKESALAPLVVDRNAPLLLTEPTENENSSCLATTSAADNTACLVCHADYEAEPLAARHSAADVGCIDCHGKSYAHRNDENNTTPPDTMYPLAEIDLSCQKCHASHDVPAAQVVARWRQRRPNRADLQTAICTDCHRDHRLNQRTVRWDKKTGELLQTGRTP